MHAPWIRNTALRRGLVSGSVAAAASGIALLMRSKRDAKTALSAQNAVSHWVWGEEAKYRHKFSARHTLLGYGIHHAASVFWGAIYERYVCAKPVPAHEELLRAAMFAAFANFVDYQLTPHRFKPGFEHHLSKRSLLIVYGAFAAGLAIGHRLQRPTDNRARGAAEAAAVGRRAPLA